MLIPLISLIDLFNLDEQFGDEDKALMLLNSLFDDYEQLSIMMLHEKDKVSYDEIYIALHSFEIVKNDKVTHRIATIEVLIARCRSLSRKLRKRGKSQLKASLVKDKCIFC